ncbi:MAG: hypothetical protein FJ197_08225 [Gammaproteobacteria bacterium]|nr:hypothetical protein [Gammaproteobacteria bacterium]
MAALIGLIQKPPLARLGVLDLESFYPAADRQTLALRLNNLLAAPGFDAWTAGAPLDAGQLLHTAAGQPRVLAVVAATYSNNSLGLNEQKTFTFAGALGTGAAGMDWAKAEGLSVAAADLEESPEPDAPCAALPEPMTRADSY